MTTTTTTTTYLKGNTHNHNHNHTLLLTLTQREQVTPFQAKVYDALLQVPPGQVTTYKFLSQAIDCSSSQAIGQALKRNPFAPQVPCHRVIRTDLTLGGFGGSFDKAPKKMQLLQEEGVQLKKNSKGEWTVNPSCVYQFN